LQKVDRLLRVFGAGFQRPVFANWCRTRAAELGREQQPFTVLLVWGRITLTVESMPRNPPEFVIRRDDGTIERSPWSEPPEL
jgi:hypothetical protein